MPELPEVEVRRRYLERTSLGVPISSVSVKDARVVKDVSPAALARGLKGAKLVAARRRAKYLLATTDGGRTLLLHFGMGGELFLRERGGRRPEWSRVEFTFEGGDCLHYINPRLIGKVALYPTTEESEIPDVARLGPEPLDRSFTFEKFDALVRSRRVEIHKVLMEQELIAGIGNIYSDEITFRAGIMPDRPVASISAGSMRRLYGCMRRVLRRAIQVEALVEDHPDEFFIPHREKGGRCPKCGGGVLSMKLGGRTSYYCPACQE